MYVYSHSGKPDWVKRVNRYVLGGNGGRTYRPSEKVDVALFHIRFHPLRTPWMMMMMTVDVMCRPHCRLTAQGQRSRPRLRGIAPSRAWAWPLTLSCQSNDSTSSSLLMKTTTTMMMMLMTIMIVYDRDVLLLEAGFITMLVAPLNFFGLHDAVWHRCHDSIAMLLVRWLLFRLTFASGLAKLTSDNQAWWTLTGQL